MKNYFFTADTHYSHSNIVKGISTWDDKEHSARDFKTLEEMNETLINNINGVVGVNDELWHLGDWSFGGFEEAVKFRNAINCKNIFFIPGNHDNHLQKMIEAKLFSDVFYIFGIGFEKKSRRKINKQRMTLSHFPFMVWDKHAKGAWQLYGHSHGNLIPTNRKQLDVGIDTHPEFRPYHFDEINEIMDNRTIELVDHHDGKR